MKFLNELTKGLIKENPTFRLLLGMCPTLAVTTLAINGLGMGAATTAVLTGSNAVISALRNVIPQKIRIPCYIVIVASLVTIVDLVMAAFTPPLHQALGIFIPLIVVNCIILGRAEAFASRNPVFPSVLDGIGMGLGFTIGLTALATIRELIGAGTVFGYPLLGSAFQPALLLILPPGAFITLGLVVAVVNARSDSASRQKGACCS